MRETLSTCLPVVVLAAILLTPALEAAPMLPAGDSTIVAFGDSTTAPRTGVTNVYADILRTQLPTDGITGSVVNEGVPGDNTNGAVSRFSTDVLNHNPDLVIMQFGINDSMVDVWDTSPSRHTSRT
jgi:lysophospholipase L1-like esterase